MRFLVRTGVLLVGPSLGGLLGAIVGTSAASNNPKGDMNCDGHVNPVDSLDILRFDAGLSVNIPGDCPSIGSLSDGSTPTPTPKPGPKGCLAAQHVTSYTDSINYIHILGDITNGLNAAADFVQITANLYSASNQLLATQSTFSCVNGIDASATSPFEVLVADPGAVDHMTVQVTDYDSPPSLYAVLLGLSITNDNNYYDNIGFYHTVGTVTNNSSNTYKYVQACTAIYDSSGNVVRTGSTFTNPDTLGPGASGTYDSLESDTGGVAFDHVAVWADADYTP